MFALKSNSLKLAPKIVLLVPCLVLFAACASKEIKNASLEPLDLPAEESSYSNPTPEPEMAAPVKKAHKKSKKARKHHKIAKHQGKKKGLKKAEPVAAAQVQNTEPPPPTIGEGTVASAPIAVPPMAPPVPFETGLENSEQPNWLLAGFVVAGIVALTGVALRVRKHNKGKRRLVYNA